MEPARAAVSPARTARTTRPARAARALQAALCAALLLLAAAAPPRYSSRIVHTHAGAIRGIIVEPASWRLEPVEVFLGVPYAAPPARLAAPPPPPRWSGTRLADTPAPVCPQALPDISNKTAALTKMPLGVYNELLASYPALSNQSEDCLYLDIYVPGSGARGVEAPYAVTAWLGGAGGGAGGWDGAVLAARGSLLVVAINYRVGLLGYLTSGSRGVAPDEEAGAWGVTAAGGAGPLDVVAALRWLRRAAAAFGGDAARLALVAPPDHAATLAAVLLLPQAKGLVSRALVLGGGALGPAAFMPDAALARSHVAQALRCERDVGDAAHGEHWLERCVRARPLPALLAVQAPRARFLAGWAPSPAPPAPPAGAPSVARALHASEAFLQCSLAIVLCTTESYQYFSEDEIRHGFEEEQRNRILRTFVRNVFRYHRNEILAAARNEYTDWDKPIQHPANIRDATMAALSDALAAAPATRLAALHAARGARTHLAHLAHAPRDSPARLGSVTGDAVPYFLGLPLVGASGAATRNYSRADAAVAEACVALLANFAKTGDPSSKDDKELVWPRYDTNTQQYLSIGSKLRVRSHYRGHKMALWLQLVPALHRAAPPAPRAHHRLRAERPDMFDGDIFPELSTTTVALDDDAEGSVPPTDECEPSPSARPALAAPPASPPDAQPDAQPDAPPAPLPALNALDAQYYSYTVALGVTVGAGCFLLALNVLVFAGIYLQRSRRAARAARVARTRDRGSGSSRTCAGSLTCDPTTLTSPRKSTLKRSSESELKERPSAAPPKKRVQIQEISV